MPKASDAEIECRIESIVDYILQGKTRSFIVRYCAELGVCERQAEEYSQRAWNRIREANDGTREDKVTRHLRRLDFVACRAIEKDNLFAALKAYELAAKIMGLEIAPEVKSEPLGVPVDVVRDMLISRDKEMWN
jgi:hypothetical protein